MKRRITVANIALVASLALNGLLGAYLVVSWGMLRTALHGGPQAVLAKLADRLPEEDGAALRAAMAKHLSSLETSTNALRGHRMALGKILEQPSIDAEALNLRLQQARGDRVQAADAIVSIFEDALPKVSLKTRRKLAKFLQKDH